MSTKRDLKASSILSRMPKQDELLMHPLVGRTALAFALEVYEERASKDNAFYAEFPDEEAWARAALPLFLPHARSILGGMLGQISTPDALKEEIYEALALDGTLPRHLGLQ